MAKVITSTSTASSKTPYAVGLCMRGEGQHRQPTLISSANPVARKAHIERLGDTQVFYMDLELGRMKEAELVAALNASEPLLKKFRFAAKQFGYTDEQIDHALGRRAAGHAKVLTAADIQAMMDAADEAAQK